MHDAAGTSWNFCNAAQVTTSSRRLLQQTIVQPCPSGTYKDRRGSGSCLVCPYGTSTNAGESGTYVGITSVVNCVCLPGFELDENGDCNACQEGYFRQPTGLNCTQCPIFAHSGLASAYCYCDLGTFQNGYDNATGGPLCLTCTEGFYCTLAGMFQCPQHSFSISGASTLSQCSCTALYYGSNGQCWLRTPGLLADKSCKSPWTGSAPVCQSPCKVVKAYFVHYA